MDSYRLPCLLLLFFLASEGLLAQVIRGYVLDAQSEQPLIGATLEAFATGSETRSAGTTTDVDGYFVLEGLSSGRHTLVLSYLGYERRVLPNVLATAGKDLILDLSMEESLTTLSTVEVSSRVDPSGNANEYATTSIRTISPEAVSRFAGGRSDISRQVGSLPGVSTTNDSRNDIVIRGNSPTGLLWQLEGVPIPSPNHFSTLGTTGGPVSAVNVNMLASSDFLTSAFPAEYGNALSGVLDLGFRRGNRDRFEAMAQIGSFSGLELMAEAPLGNRGGGSYVVSFRNSFVSVINRLFDVQIGTNATPDYRDLAFNLNLGRTPLGTISVFGIGGTSNIDFLAGETDSTDFFADPNVNAYVRSRFGVVGVRHNLLLGDNSYVRTVLTANYRGFRNEVFSVTDADADDFLTTDVRDGTGRLTLKSYYNSKVSKHLTLRAGFLTERSRLRTHFDTRDGQADADRDGLRDLNRLREFDGDFGLHQVFGQLRWRPGPRTTLNAGLRGQYFGFTEDLALEPRLNAEYRLSEPLAVFAGVGLHSQLPPLPVFFFRDPEAADPRANLRLGYHRARHYVVGAKYEFAKFWNLRTEIYYQDLYDIPVDAFPSSFSVLNAGATFVFPERGGLVNAGTGRNYGLEFTLEHYFADKWYLLLTGARFESRYTASDGVKRNTAFNNRYVANLLAGREWSWGKGGKNRFFVDTRLSSAGGRYYTPVDLARSAAADDEVLDESRAFSERFTDYFRLDFKVGVQLNSRTSKFSQSFFVDFQNLTNRENVFSRRYNTETGRVNTLYQAGFFPDVQFRIQF